MFELHSGEDIERSKYYLIKQKTGVLVVKSFLWVRVTAVVIRLHSVGT